MDDDMSCLGPQFAQTSFKYGDTGELCHAGHVPAMQGYLCLWPEVWGAEGRQEFRYTCDNYFALLQIIDDVIYFYFLAEMLVKMVRRNSQ